MKKIMVIGMIVLFLGASVVSGLKVNQTHSVKNSGRGNTFYVGGTGLGNYSTIQSAIDAASNGDTVFVYNGTYYGHITVTKTINLLGKDKETTIIDGEQYYGGVIRIFYTFGVSITGFTVKNSSLLAGDIKYLSGIRLINSNNVLISECKFLEDVCGIALDYSENNIIKYNYFTKIYSCAIFFWIGNNNVVSDNEIYSAGEGIWIGTNNNIVSDNDIYNNQTGIWIDGGSNNIIYNNNIYKNQPNEYVIGIYLIRGNNNIIYHNNLLNNKIGKNYSQLSNADDGFGEPAGEGNLWYNPALKEGNYYDDYLGMDENGDGIGDTPRSIAAFGVPETNRDEYPLIKARGIQSNPPNKPTIDGPTQINANHMYNFTAVTIDPDGDMIRYFYDWGDGTTEWGFEWTYPNPPYLRFLFFYSGEINEQSHSWDKKGDYTIKVKARDIYGYESEWATLPVTVPLDKQNSQSNPSPQTQPSTQPSSQPISKTTIQTKIGSNILLGKTTSK